MWWKKWGKRNRNSFNFSLFQRQLGEEMEAMQVTGPELDQEQPQRKKRVLILDLLQGREEGQYAGRSAPKRARGNGLVSYSHGSMPSRAFQRRCASSTHWISHLDVHTKMKGHQGCVNTIIWNSTGDLLVSGSDDTQVMIWDMNRCSLQHSYMSGHTANIFWYNHFYFILCSHAILQCKISSFYRRQTNYLLCRRSWNSLGGWYSRYKLY